MDILRRNWWLLALRGGLAVLFGIIAIVWPDITLGVLVILFGAYALVDGAFTIASAIRRAGDVPRWWVLLIEGAIGIAAGIIAWVWPGLTALALLYIIAFWAIFTGTLEVLAAVRLRHELEGEWLLALAGLLSILFGALLIAFPGAGAIAVVWIIGAYAIAFGIVIIALALRLRSGERPIMEQQPTG